MKKNGTTERIEITIRNARGHWEQKFKKNINMSSTVNMNSAANMNLVKRTRKELRRILVFEK